MMKEYFSTMKWDRYELNFADKTLIMGILNVTPDSFSDGGKFQSEQEWQDRAKEMVRQGADIIDIGGESTRPGSTPVPADEELGRVIPAIRAIRSVVDVPISIDTYKSDVAEAAIQAGASIINDVWGARYDSGMAEVAARFDVPIILMHNRERMDYTDLITDMKEDLRKSVRIAKEAGVKDERIILDPGIGFAKTYEDNLTVMRELDAFMDLGYPMLLGTSRKSLIAKTLNLPVHERVEGTGATVCLGIEKGCDIVRVHDVLEMSRMARMMDVMIGKSQVPLEKSGA
ncbi:dihydropteroate synthase [Salisediminibacterium selenitireducens]|uniref:Dihydropteroate synthase n=1 Tax=Bacillus selenitireducens (strain ATCC 700615 / DSM 15326 / MLS10) TaxID=439292 RepID=D6XV65_BACIE|nr:dihydropteroate synthase [Salisediminibacterium selenitireducens]ADH97623.1 dihydropteroate synthase [[Bacillus] selenitireducens MLS10]